MTRSRGAGGFTILEVMVSIAILALLVSALLAFGFGLGSRRDRLIREGERGATLARVVERVERLGSTARRPASLGDHWLEIRGRAVWPELGGSGVPAGPEACTGRLEFSADERQLVWRETNERGGALELVVPEIEAVLMDRFEDLALASGARAPVRVSLWLGAVGNAPPARDEPAADESLDEMATLDDAMALPLEDEDLPARPADVVFVVADPIGALGASSAASSGGPSGGPSDAQGGGP